jgi:hypothetical protein
MDTPFIHNAIITCKVFIKIHKTLRYLHNNLLTIKNDINDNCKITFKTRHNFCNNIINILKNCNSSSDIINKVNDIEIKINELENTIFNTINANIIINLYNTICININKLKKITQPFATIIKTSEYQYYMANLLFFSNINIYCKTFHEYKQNYNMYLNLQPTIKNIVIEVCRTTPKIFSENTINILSKIKIMTENHNDPNAFNMYISYVSNAIANLFPDSPNEPAPNT